MIGGSIMEDKLLNSLSKYGFPMFEPDNSFDINKTLAEVVMNDDVRLWEGFPVLLANASEDYLFSLEEVKRLLPSDLFKARFRQLVLLSLAVFSFYNLYYSWTSRLNKNFSVDEKRLLKIWRKSLAENGTMHFSDRINLDAERLKRNFELYFEQFEEKKKKENKKHDAFSLEYALSQFFSEKQKELFKKKLDGVPLTKTEREYYSRSVKKKVVALANPDLHRLALKLLS